MVVDQDVLCVFVSEPVAFCVMRQRDDLRLQAPLFHHCPVDFSGRWFEVSVQPGVY